MSPDRPLLVLVSSTYEDLVMHRQAVKDVVIELGHMPVMMEYFGSIPQWTVPACLEEVAKADLVLALCAFKRGWVPSPEEGGDGDQSITGLEIAEAKRLGKDVYILRATSWPGDLYEPRDAEREWVERFRANLNHPAAGFSGGPVPPGRKEPEPTREFRSTVKETLLQHLIRLTLKRRAAAPLRRREVAAALAELLPAVCAAVAAAPGLDADAVWAAYDAALPEGWQYGIDYQPEPVLAAVASCQNLALAQHANGTYPLLAFARALLPQVPADPRRVLAETIRRASKILGAPESVPAPAAPAPQPPSAPHPHALLIAVWSHFANDRFLVKGQLGDRPWCDEQLHTVAELGSAIARVYDELATGESRRKYVVEVFLPRELVSLPVDQWLVPVGGGRLRPLGSENPVLVRPADRYYDSQWRESREILSARWPKVVAATQVTLIRDLPPHHTQTECVYRSECAHLIYDHLIEDRAVLGAVLGEPPVGDVLIDWLMVGVPLVVWSRQSAAVTTMLAQLLEAERVTLRDLPTRIRKHRDENKLDPAHAWNNITVFFDDPNRPPPELAPPSQQLATPAGKTHG